jgi:hypothetical protein
MEYSSGVSSREGCFFRYILQDLRTSTQRKALDLLGIRKFSMNINIFYHDDRQTEGEICLISYRPIVSFTNSIRKRTHR